MSSVKKAYNLIGGGALVVFGLLIWNVQGVLNSMTYGRIGAETALDAGIKNPFGGGGEYLGYVINNDASSFVHLSFGAVQVLTWALLIAITVMAVLAVTMKSWNQALLPGAVFLIGNVIIGERMLDLGDNVLTTNVMLTVAIVTVLGMIGAVINQRVNMAPNRRAPNDASSLSSSKPATPADTGASPRGGMGN